MSGWDDSVAFASPPLDMLMEPCTIKKKRRVVATPPLDTVEVLISGNPDAARLAHIVMHPFDYPRDTCDDGPNHETYMEERKTLCAKLAQVPAGVKQWGSHCRSVHDFNFRGHIECEHVANKCEQWYKDSVEQLHMFVTKVRMSPTVVFVYTGALVSLCPESPHGALTWRFVRYCNSGIT
jgi:hypothetical protein